MCGFTGLFLLTALKVPGLGTGIVLVFVLLGVVYCVAGYLIRKGRLAGGWMGLIPAGIFSTFTLVALIVTRPISLGTVGGLALNLGIVLSLLLNWRRLRTSRTQVGA